MKTALLLLAFFLAALPAAATAKIGENEFQIQARYGKPDGQWIDYLGYKKLYHWRGYDVMVNYVNGVSQRESFGKTDELFAYRSKFLDRISGLGSQPKMALGAIMFDEEQSAFTTKAFEERYAAVRATEIARAEKNR